LHREKNGEGLGVGLRLLINADHSKKIGQTSVHKSLVNRTTLKVNVDGSDTLLFLSGSETAWGVHAMCGSESSFRWSTLETVDEWLRSTPEDFTFKAVPDDLAQEELSPGEVCSIVIGLLGGSVFSAMEVSNVSGAALRLWTKSTES
jgi:hypothetical protein